MPETIMILAGGVLIPAVPGESILAAMQAAGMEVRTICGGRGMCGMCRVAVVEEWLSLLSPPGVSEARLLNVLKTRAPNHRLGCQTILDARHDGLSFELDPPPTRTVQKETTI